MSVFHVIKKLFNLKYALVFVIFLTLEPFYIGLTRVVHLEGLLSTFMLAAFVWFYYFLVSTNFDAKLVSIIKNKVFVIAAFFTALSLLTKTSALFLLGFFPLMTFIYCYVGSHSLIRAFKKSFNITAIWLLFVFVFCFVLWPALWVIPTEVFLKLREGIIDTGVIEGHSQLYFGKYVLDPGLTYYPIVFLLKSSPYLLLGLLGSYLIRDKFDKFKMFIFYAALFAFFYFVEMSLPTKKLDRYLLPSMVVSVLISSFFFYWVLETVFSKTFYRTLVIILIPALITLYSIHPDYFSYFNPMFGGLSVGIKILEPKWMIGTNEIKAYFEDVMRERNFDKFGKEEAFDTLFANEDLGNRLVISFPEKYYTQIHPFIQEIGAWATIKTLTPHAEVSQFFVIPVWELSVYDEDRFSVEYVDTIYLRNVPVYYVFERDSND